MSGRAGRAFMVGAVVSGRAGRAFTLAAVLMLGTVPAFAADLDWSPADPVHGQETTVTLTEEGAPVTGALITAVYQPESEVARPEQLGRTGDDGTLGWTPARGGVVSLQAEIVTVNRVVDAQRREIVSADTVIVAQTLPVRYSGVPWSGLLVMVVAGLVLYGGVVRGFRLLSHAPPTRPPDT